MPTLAHWMALICLVATNAPLFAADLSLHDQTQVHFATLAEGRSFLAVPDRFINALSDFDRQSRLETVNDVSQEAFIQFVTSHVREWSQQEQATLAEVLVKLQPKLADYQLGLPTQVWLIKTTGREEGNAAYTRRHAIVLPQEKLSQSADALERLLTHELFHILSSHNPELRERCYRLVGFRVVPPVDPPLPYRNRKITNPDAPLLDSVIDLKLESETVTAIPFLFSTAERFDPDIGGPFFKYLNFRLLVVTKDGQAWKPVEEAGQPRLLVPARTADYGRQIGANTGYIIHPDEVLADNFVHLIHRTPNLRSPEIVQNLEKVLRRTESKTE